MPKGVPKDGSRKSPKERAPNWPADPRVMEVLVAKTAEVLKMPEVGGNPWQSRKLSETFRIVHEQLLASRDKVRPALCVRAPAPPFACPFCALAAALVPATHFASPAQLLFFPLGEDSVPLTAGQMLRQVASKSPAPLPVLHAC